MSRAIQAITSKVLTIHALRFKTPVTRRIGHGADHEAQEIKPKGFPKGFAFKSDQIIDTHTVQLFHGQEFIEKADAGHKSPHQADGIDHVK